ncbi:DUF5951 family protein [Klebsiella pneumoniae]
MENTLQDIHFSIII